MGVVAQLYAFNRAVPHIPLAIMHPLVVLPSNPTSCKVTSSTRRWVSALLDMQLILSPETNYPLSMDGNAMASPAVQNSAMIFYLLGTFEETYVTLTTCFLDIISSVIFFFNHVSSD
jgi:hypothetical protein